MKELIWRVQAKGANGLRAAVDLFIAEHYGSSAGVKLDEWQPSLMEKDTARFQLKGPGHLNLSYLFQVELGFNKGWISVYRISEEEDG